MLILGQKKKTSLPVGRVALTDIINKERMNNLLRLESYYRCTQHEHKSYDFDGYFIRFSESIDIPSQDYVPMKRRRPSARMDLPRVIVDRLTSMLFGIDKYPSLVVHGDEDTEDFVRELSIESRLQTSMIEARNIGGACGSVALSWGFIDGKPIIEVHQPAFIEILDWDSYHNRKPSVIIKAYPYKKRVIDSEGKPKEIRCYYARYWDRELDITWESIPEELAMTNSWSIAESKVVRHNSGVCPVVWVQNIKNSADVDGYSDFEAQDGGFDSLDILLSAIVKGTVANVDPTLVLKDEPRKNDGVVRKGSGYAIYSPGGAEYLELKGTSIQTARELIKDIRRYELDKAGVVLMDPDKLTGQGLSAAALRTRYATMLAKCDLLREQYGAAITTILEEMLEVAKRSNTIQTDDQNITYISSIKLDEKEVDGQLVERRPGFAKHISIMWPPYFPATWQDRQAAVAAVRAANGDQRILSQKTSLTSISSLFGIENIDAEIERINEDEMKIDERTRSVLDAGAPKLGLQADEESEDMEEQEEEEEEEEQE